ncbi:MAG TPA: hypothetical protein VGK61_07610 [Planctomycetota bacterium]
MPPLNKAYMIQTARQKFHGSNPKLAGPAGMEFNTYIEGMCAAICEAHNQWRTKAFFKGLLINGPTAIGGRLEGPNLELLIGANAPRSGIQGWGPKFSKAIAGVLGAAWKEYQQSFSVPGLPWYPTFAAVPNKMAAPTPNTPTPLSSCTNNLGILSPSSLKARMSSALGTPGPSSGELFESVAAGFYAAVQMWLPSQPVTNVLAKGSVPNYAPPYVPVGPVVMGDNISAPGHLLT